jgi:hypothetical protein
LAREHRPAAAIMRPHAIPLMFLVVVVALAVLPLSQAYNGTLVLEVLPLISLCALRHMPPCAAFSNPGRRYASPTSARCCSTRLQAPPPPRIPRAPPLKMARKLPTAAALTPRLPKKKLRTSEHCSRPSLSPPPPPLPLPITKHQSSSSRHTPPPPLLLPLQAALRSPPAPPASKMVAAGALRRARAAWTRRGSARATSTTCRIRESGSIYNARRCRCSLPFLRHFEPQTRNLFPGAAGCPP